MNDAGPVRARGPLSDLPRDRYRLGWGQRSFPLEPRLQGFPGVKGHRDKETALVLVGVEDRTEVGVVERSRGARLMEKALLGGFIQLELGQEEFQRDWAVQ